MSNWQKAQTYGLIEIERNNSMKLFYDRFYFVRIPSPTPFLIVESAVWQGSNILVKGKNQYGEPEIYIVRSEFESERIR